MSLHYLVKFEMLIEGVLPVRLQNISQLWPPNSPDLNQTMCGKYCRRSCTKQASLSTYDNATDEWL